MSRILIIEDELSIAELERDYLELNDFEVEIETNGAKGLDKALENDYSLILLDLMLPGMTGEEVLQLIRRQGDTPVIVLTAKDAMEEKLDLLTSGADDYITKPFDINEVIARVQIQLRHAGQEAEPDRIECGGITLGDKTHQIWVDGQEILHLTRQEYAILELLIRHPKQVFRKEAIFTYAWEEEYMGETKTLDVHISNIRKKLKAVTDKEYIQTVWGIGYRLNQ